MTSPRTPQDVLRRIIRISRLNGWSVAICAGLCTLISLPFGGLISIEIGLAVTIGGAMEIRGSQRLRRRDLGGMTWLVRSQLVVLGAIWIYALPRLFGFDPTFLQDQAIPNLREMLSASGLDLDSMLAQAGVDANSIVPLVRLFTVVLYGTVLVVTLIYQGGMALYYHHSRAVVEAALKAPLIPPPMAPDPTPVPERSFSLSEADQRYYDRVAEELAQGIKKPGLWARAMAESGAEDGRTRALYIRLRVAEMQREEGRPASS